MSDTMITTDQGMDFLMLIHEADPQAITDWLGEHVTSVPREFQIFETLPRIAAVFVQNFPGVPDLGPDDGWIIQQLEPDRVTQATLQSAQLLGAALNGDEDALTGLVRGIVGSPESHRVDVMFELIKMVRDFMKLTVDQVKTNQEGTS